MCKHDLKFRVPNFKLQAIIHKTESLYDIGKDLGVICYSILILIVETKGPDNQQSTSKPHTDWGTHLKGMGSRVPLPP